ncbi:MAG: tetratricopeptide repeat protein, partial [Phycisphaerae bacterium]|nr:tetratricopeptide repeat protein [Phycisphaerae bacterium]
AEKLDPDNPRLYRYRGWVYSDSKKNVEADTAFTKALKLDPRYAWSWYMRGRIRVRQKKYADGMKDYDEALALNPRFSSAYSSRARLHLHLKDYAKAIKDCDGALAVSPYYADPYHVRGRAYEKSGKPDRAIHDQAIARLLHPNMRGPNGDLPSLVKKAKVSGSTTRPASFQQPKKGLAISYLMTVSAMGPKKDEMEEAIGGLVSFFKREILPMPKSRTFIVRQVAAGKDNTTTIKPTSKYPAVDRKKPPVATMDYYRTLFPRVLPMGRSGQVLTIEHDLATIDALWPLKVGNKSAGAAKIFFVGPDPLTPPAKFFECKKPGDKIPFGQLKWSGQVVKREKVTVPAGVFDAFVIRVEDETELVMMGRSKKRSTVLTWWYAPSVRWWVKRTQEVGKDIIVNEAESIK